MTAEIISVGTELLLGNILNTNAQYLSRELAELGITVQRESTIGDNQGRLADFVNEAKSRCDLLVFTGGLGPTADDLTKETVAACYGDTLVFDESEWEKITGYFARSGRVTTPNNRKQAMVPVKGHKIINHHGTAPGAWFEQEGRCAVLMPGVPSEMKAMWNESVRPLLMKRQNCTLHSVTLHSPCLLVAQEHLVQLVQRFGAVLCVPGKGLCACGNFSLCQPQGQLQGGLGGAGTHQCTVGPGDGQLFYIHRLAPGRAQIHRAHRAKSISAGRPGHTGHADADLSTGGLCGPQRHLGGHGGRHHIVLCNDIRFHAHQPGLGGLPIGHKAVAEHFTGARHRGDALCDQPAGAALGGGEGEPLFL